tara:strand:- start:334 stop:846 length:513 start_codon:yes stop_codon:yes gene_type:complete
MPTGLKSTSSLITVGFDVLETAPGVFTQNRIDLQLNPLDNEVFVVQAINLDCQTPDAIAATNTGTTGSLSTTSQTVVGNLSNSGVMANAALRIRAAGFVDGGVAFEQSSMETPPSGLDYIGIIATNDFFIQVQGTANIGAKGMSGRMYGYRAKASSSIYAALVQSELLTA